MDSLLKASNSLLGRCTPPAHRLHTACTPHALACTPHTYTHISNVFRILYHYMFDIHRWVPPTLSQKHHNLSQNQVTSIWVWARRGRSVGAPWALFWGLRGRYFAIKSNGFLMILKIHWEYKLLLLILLLLLLRLLRPDMKGPYITCPPQAMMVHCRSLTQVVELARSS